MSRIQSLLIAGLTVLMVSCASKNFQEPGDVGESSHSTKRTYRGSYTDIWNATLAALGQRKYPVARADRQGGAIVTDWVTGKSDRLFSGYGETRIPYNVRFKFTMRVRPSSSGVEVSIANEEQYYTDSITGGMDFSGSLYQWVPTESSRAKEAALLDEIAQALAAPGGGK